MNYKKAALILVTVAIFVIISGCNKSDSSPTGSNSNPTISSVSPTTAAVNDTLSVTGTNFGATQGTSTVIVGGQTVTVIYSWSSTLIRLKVPQGAVTGAVIISVGGVQSNTMTLTVSGASGISFSRTIFPIFSNNRCLNCHGGTGGLYLNTVAQILQGGNHGAAVVHGNADASHIIQKVSSSTPPFGSQMPYGGPYLNAATIDTLKQWINKGALNN
jgi:hypothetical protein